MSALKLFWEGAVLVPFCQKSQTQGGMAGFHITILGKAMSPRNFYKCYHIPMRITKIETFKFWILWCNWLFVKVSTDEGLYGWGEGSLQGANVAIESVIHDLEPYLVGQDPSGIERHWQAIYRAWPGDRSQPGRARGIPLPAPADLGESRSGVGLKRIKQGEVGQPHPVLFVHHC